MVTIFEIWRYFPLSFLFILARMQSIDPEMYEAAIWMAPPFQKFWFLSMPQLMGILSVLFLLRFIWTFNKFDDIFLLTGGNAGTRTLTVNVYEQAFAVSNIESWRSCGSINLLLFDALFDFLFQVYQSGGRFIMRALRFGFVTRPLLGIWMFVLVITVAVMSFATDMLLRLI